MSDSPDAAQEAFLRIAALHKYFLNADFLRDILMRRIKRQRRPVQASYAESMDDAISMSLWYAALYVVIEGWRETKLEDPALEVLLQDPRVDELRRFRNQVFHYQPKYDNPKLLGFLGADNEDAHSATEWIKATHASLGRAIEHAMLKLMAAARPTP